MLVEYGGFPQRLQFSPASIHSFWISFFFKRAFHDETGQMQYEMQPVWWEIFLLKFLFELLYK